MCATYAVFCSIAAWGFTGHCVTDEACLTASAKDRSSRALPLLCPCARIEGCVSEPLCRLCPAHKISVATDATGSTPL